MPNTFKKTVATAGFGQPNFSTCWWASYRMLYQYLKRQLKDIDEKLAKLAKIDVDDCKENGLADTDYSKAATALGLRSWSGLSFNKSPLIDIGLSDGAKAFLKELDLGPLWVSRVAESRPGKKKGYHIVVAVGYDDASGNIIYNNPFPGPKDAIETSKRANNFVKLITAAQGSVQGYRYTLGDS